ncbi:hypothetical protein GF337_02530 [candidate division KSB1 bacterium]|nr:hypothetical protein [candidate division KSB1 bacterium]
MQNKTLTYSTHIAQIVKLSLLIGFGAFVGLLSLKLSFSVFLIFLVPAVLILAWNKEEFGILLIIIITASIIWENQLPALHTPFGNFHLVDLYLFFSLISIFIKYYAGKNESLIRTPLDVPLLIFFGFSVISMMLAVTVFSVSIRTAFSELRIITYYLLFFLVTNLLHTKTQLRRLIHGLYLIAIVVVFFMIAQVLLGTSIRIIPARVESLLTMGKTYTNTIRVITPGNSLIFVMFLVACCTFIMQKSMRTIYNFANVIILGIGLIIGFNRNLWIPAIIGMILFFFISPKQCKIRFIGFSVLMAFVLALVIVFAYITDGKLKNYTESTFIRLFTVTKGNDLVRKDTLIDRIIENRYAWNEIRSHPVFGIGLGNNYRHDVDWNPKLNAYIHNGFLWILMKTGILGFTAFMWFLLAAIVRGFRYWNKGEDSFLNGAYIGFTLACIGFMLSALVNPVFMQWHSSPIIGVMLGSNELIQRLNI